MSPRVYVTHHGHGYVSMPTRNGQTEAGRKREVLRLEPDSVTVPHSTVFPQAKKGRVSRKWAGVGCPTNRRRPLCSAQPSTPAGAQQAKEPTLTVSPGSPPANSSHRPHECQAIRC